MSQEISRRTFFKHTVAEGARFLVGATVLSVFTQVEATTAHASSYLQPQDPAIDVPQSARNVPLGVNLFDGAYDPNYQRKLARLQKIGVSAVRIIAANNDYHAENAAMAVNNYLWEAHNHDIKVAVVLMNQYCDQGHIPREVDLRYCDESREPQQLDQSLYKAPNKAGFLEYVDTMVDVNSNHPALLSWQLINEMRTKTNLVIPFMKDTLEAIRRHDKRTKVFSGFLSSRNAGISPADYGKMGLHVTGNYYDDDESKFKEIHDDAYWALKNKRDFILTELGCNRQTPDRIKKFSALTAMWENAGAKRIFYWGLQSHKQPFDPRYGLTEGELAQIIQQYHQKD